MTHENENFDGTRRLDVELSAFTLKYFEQCDVYVCT